MPRRRRRRRDDLCLRVLLLLLLRGHRDPIRKRGAGLGVGQLEKEERSLAARQPRKRGLAERVRGLGLRHRERPRSACAASRDRSSGGQHERGGTRNRFVARHGEQALQLVFVVIVVVRCVVIVIVVVVIVFLPPGLALAATIACRDG